jgi:hypothetical protein
MKTATCCILTCLAIFLAACSTVPFEPTEPPYRAVLIKEPFKSRPRGLLTKCEFPRGIYKLHKETKDAFYFLAPSRILPLRGQGGVFVRKDNLNEISGWVIDNYGVELFCFIDNKQLKFQTFKNESDAKDD